MAAKYTDNRNSGRPQPVWRVKLAQFSWANGEEAVDEKIFPICGTLKAYTTVISTNDGTATMTVSIEDEDDYELYSLAAITTGTTTVTKLSRDNEIYIPPGSVIKVLPSGDPGTSGVTVDVTFYGI